VQVPEAFIGISFVAFARKNITLPQGWASLAPYRVGFITGWKTFEAEATQARVVNKVDGPEQLFRMLEADRIDLALYTLADGQALLKQGNLSGIAVVQPHLLEVDMYLYLHQRHADWASQIAIALKAMKRDGTHQRILAAL
jgi:polar amino acid transport system substrate-binding protein